MTDKMPDEIFVDTKEYVEEGHLHAWHTCHSEYIRYIRADLAPSGEDVIRGLAKQFCYAFDNHHTQPVTEADIANRMEEATIAVNYLNAIRATQPTPAPDKDEVREAIDAHESGRRLSERQINALIAAASRQPERVTIRDLAEMLHIEMCDSYESDMTFISQRFPNGLILTKE